MKIKSDIVADPLEVENQIVDGAESFKFGKTRAGFPMLIDQFNCPYVKSGGFYSKKFKKQSIYWKCARFQNQKNKLRCPSRIITIDNKFVARKSEHNHEFFPCGAQYELMENTEPKKPEPDVVTYHKVTRNSDGDIITTHNLKM